MPTSRPAPTNEGLVGNMVSGYAVAWAARRPLAAVLLPVVATMVLLPALLDLGLGGGRLVIVDGIVEPRHADAGTWASLTIVVLLGLVGLVAAAWAIRRRTGPVEALRHSLAHLPAFAIGAVAAVGCFLLTLWVVVSITAGRMALVLPGGMAAGAGVRPDKAGPDG